VAGLAAVAGATRLPVLAIGGVTAARIGEVMAAGASGVAGIRMFDTSRRVP
jgi:thiamine-phosphate pyrophosphorylase